MKGFFKRLGNTWTITGIALLLMILIEVFFRIYLYVSPSPDPRSEADCYGNADWVGDYYRELARSAGTRWEPYVYWKVKPAGSGYINVDEKGHRRTVTKSNPISQRDKEVNIFFFGGSAMWGAGVRDPYTIPSLACNELLRRGINADATNCGTPGYVSSQEAASLINELRQGNIPDIVVFYGGATDMLSSYLSGSAGLTLHEEDREDEYNALKEKRKGFLVFMRSLKTLSTFKFIARQFASDSLIYPTMEEMETEDLATRTALIYNENIRMVNALAKEYGFQALFYWQPTLFDKPYQTDYETREAGRAGNLRPFLEQVNAKLFDDDLAYEHIRFQNLSGIFKTSRQPLFIDWYLTGEEGNLEIAKQMTLALLPVIDTVRISSRSAD